MKYDIQIHGNAISGRQGWAYTCNSNEIPVLKADINSRVNAVEGAYKNFGNVRVAWNRNNNALHCLRVMVGGKVLRCVVRKHDRG